MMNDTLGRPNDSPCRNHLMLHSGFSHEKDQYPCDTHAGAGVSTATDENAGEKWTVDVVLEKSADQRRGRRGRGCFDSSFALWIHVPLSHARVELSNLLNSWFVWGNLTTPFPQISIVFLTTGHC